MQGSALDWSRRGALEAGYMAGYLYGKTWQKPAENLPQSPEKHRETNSKQQVNLDSNPAGEGGMEDVLGREAMPGAAHVTVHFTPPQNRPGAGTRLFVRRRRRGPRAISNTLALFRFEVGCRFAPRVGETRHVQRRGAAHRQAERLWSGHNCY